MALSDTVKMVKGNREMTVAVKQKAEFLRRGFSVIDDDGNVTEAGRPTEIDLRKQIEKLQKENKSLKVQVTKLKKKLGEDPEQKDAESLSD